MNIFLLVGIEYPDFLLVGPVEIQSANNLLDIIVDKDIEVTFPSR